MAFTWRDQMRVPKGNGRFSGRWVDMPWRTASKLLKALSDIDSERGLFVPGSKDAVGSNGKLRDAIGEALQAATKAEARSRGIDFDPSDSVLAKEAARVTDSLEKAYDIVRKSRDQLVVLDLNTGSEVKGEAKTSYLAEYADALLDAHRNADLFSSTDWSNLPRDDRSVVDEARLDNEFPLDGDDGGASLLERGVKKAAWEAVEAVRDDDEDEDGDDEGDDEPLPTEPAPVPDGMPAEAGPAGPNDTAPAALVFEALDALASTPGGGGETDAFRPDLADALRNDWREGLLGTIQTGPDSVDLVAPDGTIVATVSLDGVLVRGPGYEPWVEGAQSRYPGHRFWHSSEEIIRDIIENAPMLASQPRKEPIMSLQSRFGERLSSMSATAADPDVEVTVDPAEAAEAFAEALADVTPISHAPSLLASAAPMNPPAEWFADPKLAAPTGLVVTPEGRIYGHVASWGICHIAHTNQCITAPHSRTGYAYFRTGTVLTEEGSLIPVGKVTLDTTHAGPRLNALSAAQHYENTGAAVADVAAGEDQWGIWIAGAVRPSATADQIRALRAAPLSGDWREVDGNLEMVAALSVNVPGFPIPRPIGLVASGVLRSLVASGMVPPAPPRTRLEALAMRGHTPTTAEDIEYLKHLAAKAAAVVAEAEAITEEAAGEVVELDDEDCGCDATFTVADLDQNVLALANKLKMAKMAETVRALRSTPTVVSDPEAMTTYGCNCRNKTRPMGMGSKATTTNTTTAKPKQSFAYTPPSGAKVTDLSLLQARAAAKRNGGQGTITPM